jgi:NAD(P)-dependent dehydrogenase (short-subunit alcohol dehydrogenase family)
MSGEVAIVTGATGALGEATASNLARLGWAVVIASRDETRGERVLSRIKANDSSARVAVLPLDLSSPTSIRGMVGQFHSQFQRLDALIHTAAVFLSQRQCTPEGRELMFATNHLGPFLLTRLLLEEQLTERSLRVVLVTAPSTTSVDFEDLQGERRFRPLWAFGATKMCNLLFTYALARRFQGSANTANAFHPGLIKSNLMKEAPAPMRVLTNLVSSRPEKAAASLASIATNSRYTSVSGKFFKGEQEIRSNPYSLQPTNQERLWEISTRLTGLTP